eukprot:Amastigsp_a176835_230.p2 type:complete len:101 gc:universal Amastigsp_a176835_230:270-572(+)
MNLRLCGPQQLLPWPPLTRLLPLLVADGHGVCLDSSCAGFLSGCSLAAHSPCGPRSLPWSWSTELCRHRPTVKARASVMRPSPGPTAAPSLKARPQDMPR